MRQYGVIAAAGAMLMMEHTAERLSRVPEHDRPNLKSQLLKEFMLQRRLLKEKGVPFFLKNKRKSQ